MIFHDLPEPSPRQVRREAYEQLRDQGDLHFSQNRWREAETCYRQAAVLAPQESAPFIGLGAVAMQTHRPEEALRAFQTARSIDPQCEAAHVGSAMIHQDAGRFPQAFEMYLRSLEINSDNFMALLGLFQASCQMGTFAKIMHYLEQYLQKHPDDTAVLYCLATLQAREGQWIEAKESLLTVLASEPGKREAQELLDELEQRLATGSAKEVA